MALDRDLGLIEKKKRKKVLITIMDGAQIMGKVAFENPLTIRLIGTFFEWKEIAEKAFTKINGLKMSTASQIRANN